MNIHEPYRVSLWICEGLLDLIEGDQGPMIKVMRKAKGLYVFLQSRGNLSVVAPKLVSLKFRLHVGIDSLYFA